MTDPRPLHLFDGYGVELEYMIVDAGRLSVMPACDAVLERKAGRIVPEVEAGEIAWSNELVLHVIELKTNGPAPALAGLSTAFQDHVAEINRILGPMGGRLMPTAAHPWMDPLLETRLWPHEYSPIYEAYDRIFGCRGHGWSNLQSVHINLPFHDDAEFGRLHAAIRLLMPIMPALTAASPILDGRPAGILDARMEVYRHNADRIPSVTGRVVPEPVFTRADYEERILSPMYREIAPHDPQGVLREEFLNARGAIARFDRSAIEIRVLDIQECPRADLATASLITAALKGLSAERWTDLAAQQRWETGVLADLFLAVIRDGEKTLVDNPEYLRALGYPGGRASAGEVWTHLLETCGGPDFNDSRVEPDLRMILERGPLSRRILAALGGDFRREALGDVYGALCGCLARGELFT